MANLDRQREVFELMDTLDRSVAYMLPRVGDTAAGARAAEAVRTFAGAVGELEAFLKQLQQFKPTPQGPTATQEQELEELQAEAREKDRLIATARTQIERWQEVIRQQEQLQENTLFAGSGS